MRIGSMRHEIEVQAMTLTTDAGGGASQSFATTKRMYADIRPTRGSEAVRQGKLQTEIGHQITVRYHSFITNRHKVLFDGRSFNINYIENVDERDRFMILHCEENVAV